MPCASQPALHGQPGDERERDRGIAVDRAGARAATQGGLRTSDAPFGPALAQLGDTGEISPASRRGDTLTISPTLYADQALPARFAWAAGPSSRSTLFRKGEPLAASSDFFPPVRASPGPARGGRVSLRAGGGARPSPRGGPDIFDLSILHAYRLAASGLPPS